MTQPDCMCIYNFWGKISNILCLKWFQKIRTVWSQKYTQNFLAHSRTPIKGIPPPDSNKENCQRSRNASLPSHVSFDTQQKFVISFLWKQVRWKDTTIRLRRLGDNILKLINILKKSVFPTLYTSEENFFMYEGWQETSMVDSKNTFFSNVKR